MATFTLKIVDVRQETNDTVTLCFKQPGLKKIKYLAGQYLTLIFRINGRRYIRPYSFSSAPELDSYLEITVKRIPQGIVSNHIHDFIKVGDTIEVMAPMGEFTCEDTAYLSSVTLWATGSGITPLISIAKNLLSKMDGPKIYLFYGNRTFDSVIFSEQISRMLEKFPKRFEVKHFHSQSVVTDLLPNVIQGRINTNVALELLKSEDNVSNSVHYICGAPGFKESVKIALKAIGIEKDRIFSEDFELIKDPKDFEKINTEIVRIRFGLIDHEVEVVKGKSILEAALDANIDLPYSCQTGSCSTCKAIILQGRVTMIGLPEERNDLQSDEYLLCCSYPESNNTYIKID